MLKIIHPAKKFSGLLRVPSDKSLTHRAVLFASLAEGVSTIRNPLEAEDCISTAKCIEALGCKVDRDHHIWTVHGVGLWGFKAPSQPLDCGNSGTTMRLLAGVLAAQSFISSLIGDSSLSSRPMDRVAHPLREMGATIELREGRYAPMRISGTKNLRAIDWKSQVASAQVKSCVLLAALHTKGVTSFLEPSLSRDHTERMLEASGVSLERKGSRVSITGPVTLKPQMWDIPGDISSAAFFLVGALLCEKSDLVLQAVNVNETRTGILDVLKSMGAKIRLENMRIVGGEPVADILVKGKPQLKAAQVDRAISPRLIDEIPILAVAATQAEGVSIIKGVAELRHKESDRIAAMAKNLNAMGAKVKEESDGLIIQGSTPLRGAEVKSYADHRIAMAMAVAGLIASGETRIQGSEAVSISFPSFWDLLDKLCHR